MAVLDINLRPDRRTLRTFGFVCLVGFGLLGLLIWWRGGLFGLGFGSAAMPVAWALWGLGGLAAMLSLVAPGANRVLFVGLVVLTYPIGWVVSHVLMGVVFYGVLTPVGLFFRLIGRDPLHRRFDRQAASYWVPHRRVDRVERYFRQF
jgi:hypothetical protein